MILLIIHYTSNDFRHFYLALKSTCIIFTGVLHGHFLHSQKATLSMKKMKCEIPCLYGLSSELSIKLYRLAGGDFLLILLR